MSVFTPERRTAMYHAQLAMGAVMANADGWQLPGHYGDVSREAAWLRETVGVSDVTPIGKLRVVGEDAAQVVSALVPSASELLLGSVAEVDSTLQPGGKLLAARLTPDEFFVLTPPGQAQPAMDNMQNAGSAACAHMVDVTSGLCAVSFIGPSSTDLFGRVTELDTSPGILTDLTCVQSRFAEVQGLLLRRDTQGLTTYHLYTGREFGEYLWGVLSETAHEVGGGPVGAEALMGLRGAE